MKHSVYGTIAQYVRLDFEAQSERAWVNNGSLMSYSREISWRLAVPGGVGGALKRSLAGEGLSLTQVSTGAPGQHALISANSPGHVLAWDLDRSSVITTRGSFLAAWGEIDITVSVARRAGAAFFGGVGLFLQKISGTGVVLVHGRGDLEQKELGPSEHILVSTGNLAAFDETVDYDIETVGGVRKFLFGQEGLFVTRLKGPGRVILQSLKPSKASGK